MHLNWRISILLLAILLQSHNATPSKILIISPNLANSMILYVGRIADVLQKEGHDVSMLILEIRNNMDRINGTKFAKVIRMENLGGYFDKVMSGYSNPFLPFHESVQRRRGELVAMTQNCEEVLKRLHELEHLRHEKFDLAITDHVDFCDIALTHALNIKLHVWTATGSILDINAWPIGIPPETSYVPVPWETNFGPKMNLWERGWNLLRLYMDRLVVYEHVYRINQLFRRYVDPSFPSVFDLAANSDLLFVNSDEFLEPSRPLPSKVIHIGGVGLNKVEQLSQKEFSQILRDNKTQINDSTKFVLFSLGSSASTQFIEKETKRQILEAFSQLSNYQFIVKVDREDSVFRELGTKHQNVHIVDWVPQQRLLSHPNLKAFITHGGHNSILESIINGVPMLVLPLFFDQHRNAKMLEYRGVGRILYPHLITTESLKTKLMDILKDQSYHHNAKRLSRLFHEKPNRADETLVKWINFVLNNGPLVELKPEALSLNWFSYSNLDVFCLFVVFAWITLKVFVKLLMVLKFLMENLKIFGGWNGKVKED